ncbi:MAG: O-antigen ligase family protein [Methylacidiphilales bacterium]|nr:O-antigen ligase family protein [Candidatus Methylacidiphilales bacterium]
MTFFSSASRWLLFACLVYSPWAYGSTRPWTVEILNAWLLTCLVLQAMGWIVEKRFPRFPILPSACLILLLFESGWMYYNAHSYFDDAFEQFVSIPHPFPNLPGSCDKAATLFTLQTQAVMAGVFWLVLDLVSNRVWKRRLWLTMGLAGLSIVLLGLSQRAFQAPSIFWLKENTGSSFFGAYRYHANAGAFLNLIWPVLACLLVQSWRKKDANFERAFWCAALFLTVAGCFINTSRGANAITLVLLPLGGLWLLPKLNWGKASMSIPVRLVIALVVLAAIAIAIWGDATIKAKMRWEHLDSELNMDNLRLLVYEACLRTIPDAGWFGFGPGTFSIIFPFHTQFLGDRIFGFWRFAHEDYLQTVIEYGYAGAAVWAIFFFSGLAHALRRSFQAMIRTSDTLMFRASSLALLSVALHSLVDFPLQIASILFYVTVFLAVAWHRPDVQIQPHPASQNAETSKAAAKTRLTSNV